MNQLVKTLETQILGNEEKFAEIASIHGAVKFKKECSFALQHLSKNKFLCEVAQNNPQSLSYAILNVAAIGISLCPQKSMGYLVPRKGEIVLDVSYQGLCYLGELTGAIEWIQAKIVHKLDFYENRGVGNKPIHRYGTYSERGEIVGVYCVAKLTSGDYLTEEMKLVQVHNIMERSESYKAYKNKKVKSSPWISDFEEMAKKTVVKRASKLWPKVSRDDRFSKAIDLSNTNDSIDFESESVNPICPKEKQDQIYSLLKFLDRTEEAFAKFTKGAIFRDAKINELTDQEADKLIIALVDMKEKLEKTKAKEKEAEEKITPDITVDDIEF